MRMRQATLLACAAGLALFTQGAAAASDEDDPLFVRGRAVFNGNCHECHTVDPGWLRRMPAPMLYGVIGRKAGTLAGATYSDAMKKSGIVWTPELIEKYLVSPLSMIPGNQMTFVGLKSADDRKAVVAYIAKASLVPAPTVVPQEETTGLTMKRAE